MEEKTHLSSANSGKFSFHSRKSVRATEMSKNILFFMLRITVVVCQRPDNVSTTVDFKMAALKVFPF